MAGRKSQSNGKAKKVVKKQVKTLPGNAKQQDCKHRYEKYPGTTTKLVKSRLRQGSSSVTFDKYDKVFKVRCDKCGKVTWKPEGEFGTDEPQNATVAHAFDILEKIAAAEAGK